MPQKTALLILTLVLYGCVSEPQTAVPALSSEFNEKIFLDNAPCSAPCWQNLTVGISKKKEVLEEISKFNFLTADGITTITQQIQDINSENMVNGEVILVACINRPEPCMELTIADDTLKEIYIKLDNGLLITQIIEKFGPPDYVGSHYKGGEVTDCRVEAIWLSQQIVLYSNFLNESDSLYNGCVWVDDAGLVPATVEIFDVRFLPLPLIKESIDRRALSKYGGLK